MLIEVALGPTSLQSLLQPHLLPHSSTCQYSAVSPYEQNSVTIRAIAAMDLFPVDGTRRQLPSLLAG